MLLKSSQLNPFLVGILINGLVLSLSHPVFAQIRPNLSKEFVNIPITFEPPPGQDRPDQTAGGGSRGGGRCPHDSIDEQPLTALVTKDPVYITSDPYPTVQIQVPQTMAETAEFSLFDANGNGVYQTSISLPAHSQVIDIHLPANEPALQPNQNYQWVFALVCEPNDRLQDRSISGWIRRVESGLPPGEH
jgi:hypothetical protein